LKLEITNFLSLTSDHVGLFAFVGISHQRLIDFYTILCVYTVILSYFAYLCLIRCQVCAIDIAYWCLKYYLLR